MGDRLAIVTMPWRLPHIPPLGPATLKSAIQQASQVEVDIIHLDILWMHWLNKNSNLSINSSSADFIDFTRTIGKLSGILQAGEWMFAQSLFQSRLPFGSEFRHYFKLATAEQYDTALVRDFLDCSLLVQPFLSSCLKKYDWNQYAYIGFSCVFYQLNASLAFASLLRDSGYHDQIIFGGPLCEGTVGKNLLLNFPFIDIVFDGQADSTFPDYIVNGQRDSKGQQIPGAWMRTLAGEVRKGLGGPPLEINRLPRPDFGSYYLAAERAGIRAQDILYPIEASRGCWWGERNHCIFCGLNGSDMQHRTRSTLDIFQEISEVYVSNNIRRFTFTDNILSPALIKTLAPLVAESNLKPTFEAEVKSNLSRRQIQMYKRAGFTTLQLGIESLSSSVLKIMDKGVTALSNIAALKWCAEANITAIWNLLYGFPGEREDDFLRIRSFLPAIVHLRPPMLVTPMTVARFSPAFNRSEALGFKNRRPSAFYRFMYPFPDEIIGELAQCFDSDFDDDLDRASAVRPIKEYVRYWRNLEKSGYLVFDPDIGKCGASALFDTRLDAPISFYELNPLQTAVFQLCDRPISARNIIQTLATSEFNQVHESAVLGILAKFVEKRYVVTEDDTFLNVAFSDTTFVPWTAIAALDAGIRNRGRSFRYIDAELSFSGL